MSDDERNLSLREAGLKMAKSQAHILFMLEIGLATQAFTETEWNEWMNAEVNRLTSFENPFDAVRDILGTDA